jgi:hypothetical protein
MKRWWQSKTVWFNVATGLIGIGTEAAALVDAVPEGWQETARLGLVALVAVGNVILRLVTSEPVR